MQVVKELSYIFDKKNKVKLLFLFILILGSAFLELIGVSAIMPLVNIIVDSTSIYNNQVYYAIYSYFGMNNEKQFVMLMTISLIFVYIIKNIYIVIMYYFQFGFTYNYQRSLAVRLTNCYMKQPYVFHLSKNVAELQRNVIDDVTMFFQAVLGIIQFITEILVSLLLVAYLLYIDKSITLAIMIFLLFFAIAYLKLFKNKSVKWGEENRYTNVIRNKWIRQSFEGIKEIKIVNREQFFIDKVDKYYKAFANATKKQQLISNIPRPLFEAACVTAFLSAITIKIAKGVNLNYFLPVISAFAIAAFRLLPSFGRLTTAVNTIAFNYPAVNALYNDLYEADKFNYKDEHIESDVELSFNHEISVNNLTFKYPSSEKTILDNVSLCIPKNKSVAIIGASGSGKTTLVDVILGILQPISGSVMTDGIDIYSNINKWHEYIGYIPQMIYLMDDTIRNNVLFGFTDDIDNEEKVWKALEEAQLKSFVEELEDGLDTVIGERGVRLSGGQRQRIGIARALYNDPKILVLDEATSALDNETENAVMEAIDGLHGRKTMIVIAHRLSTIKNCDIVYRVEDGKVIKNE